MITKYLIRIYGTLTQDEISTALSIYNKVLGVFKDTGDLVKEEEGPVKNIRKIIIE